MSKAGLFAGEVTTLAPEDGAETDKPRSYVWMEYGANQLEPPLITFVTTKPYPIYAFDNLSAEASVEDIGIIQGHFEFLDTVALISSSTLTVIQSFVSLDPQGDNLSAEALVFSSTLTLIQGFTEFDAVDSLSAEAFIVSSVLTPIQNHIPLAGLDTLEAEAFIFSSTLTTV